MCRRLKWISRAGSRFPVNLQAGWNRQPTGHFSPIDEATSAQQLQQGKEALLRSVWEASNKLSLTPMSVPAS